MRRLLALWLIFALISMAPADSLVDERQASEMIAQTLAEQTGAEVNGIRVSIQYMRWSKSNLIIGYRFEATTKPRTFVIDRPFLTLKFLFWDRKRKEINSNLAEALRYSVAFEEESTQKDDFELKVTPPAEARYIAIRFPGLDTKMVAIPRP